MKEIDSLYENERVEQEVRSNRIIFKSILWVFVFFSVIWFLNLLRIFIVPVRLMNTAYFITSIFVIISVLIYYFCDLSEKITKYLFLILVCFACGATNSILSIHAILMFALPIMLASFYRSDFVLWFTCALNTVCMAVSTVVAFYYGICDLNLLLDSSQTRDFYMSNYIDGALVNNLNENHMFVILVFAILPRALILLGFTLVLRYLNKSIKADMTRIASLTYSKETDLATGVYNKNKLEELIKDYYPTVSFVGVVYIDINNLKTVNDKYGHDMGDRLISAAVRPIKKYQNDRYSIFRFGGDEFVIIIENPSRGEMDACIKDIRNSHSRIVLPNKINISVAIGKSEGYGSSIEDVIKEADERMYQNKREIKGEA